MGVYVSPKLWFASVWFYGFNATLDLAMGYYSVSFRKYGIVFNF